tara:strand:+ start:2674 stop:3222 length:549 start_codon:yes stop_codon:yes gene_type:complete
MSLLNIMLVGVSGVGKSTFVNSLEGQSDFQLLSAGSIIKQRREKLENDINRDELRFADITDNQALLIDGFHDVKNTDALYVILDGHVVIDTPTGLQSIASDVFKKMGINMFIFLKSEPQQIKLQRERDTKRQRPRLSVGELSDHQNLAIEVMKRIADEIDAVYQIVTADQTKETYENIRNFK